MKLRLTQAVSAFSLLAAACGPLPEAPESDGEQFGHTAQMIRRERAIPNEYIVVLRDSAQEVRQQGAASIAQELVSLTSGRVLRTYEHSIHGFLANMSEAEARRTARFSPTGHTPGPVDVEALGAGPGHGDGYPRTLDLRRPGSDLPDRA